MRGKARQPACRSCCPCPEASFGVHGKRVLNPLRDYKAEGIARWSENDWQVVTDTESFLPRATVIPSRTAIQLNESKVHTC
jgi:hypothetical protein